MRKPFILAAALMLLPVTPAFAQRPAAAPASPRLALTAEQSAELRQAVTRGRALAVFDQAARLTSADMLSRLPDPDQAGITGWVALPEGNGVTVTYYARAGDGFEAVYRGQVLGARVTAPQLFAAGSRPALTGPALRMAAARTAAEAVENSRCGGPAFNLLTLTPESDGTVLVYQMSPRMAADRVPAAGHYRISVAADGSIARSVPLAGACSDLVLPPVPPRQQPRPVGLTAPDAALPNELHVFLSLWTGRPIVVAAGTDPVRLWGVTGQRIGALSQ